MNESVIESIARLLKGEPNHKLSKVDDKRFGSHGSLSVKPSKRSWFDHEANKGGGVLDLVVHLGAAIDHARACEWLKNKGLQTSSPKAMTMSEEIFSYMDAQGLEVFQVVRTNTPSGKQFKQRRIIDGQIVWSLKGVERVLYRLPQLLSANPNEVIFVVEGEKCVHALEKHGLLATTNAGGAGKWLESYNTALKGRKVVILPDNDKPGFEHAAKVAQSLKSVAKSVTVVKLPGLPQKGDVFDWFAAGHTKEELIQLTEKAIEPPAQEMEISVPGAQGENESQTDMLVNYVRERFDVAHDKNRDGLAISKTTGEAYRLSSQSFRDDLLAGFYKMSHTAVRDSSLREAMMTINAMARATGEPRDANVRVAVAGDGYLVDIGKPGDSRAIHITPGKWHITNSSDALFIRGNSMQPLAEPVAGGDVNLLWRMANIPEAQRLLVLAWLIDCLRPDTPYPLLELIGEQGSGKSLTSEALRRVIDPNAANLRAEPKNSEDLFVIAHHNHVVALENISRLTPQQQDSACILATGGGFAKRKLYSDSDESVIVIQRPVMLNGIVAAVTQQDLVDRCISLECPVLEGRLTSVEMWREFNQNLPSILGGLLDLAAKALSLLSKVELPTTERPRLAEYAILGCAVAMAMGKDQHEFMTAFNTMRAETVGRTLEASPVAVAVQELVDRYPNGMEAPLKDILSALEEYRPLGTDAWPRSPKGLGDALRRAAPALRTLGVECKSLGKIGSSVRWSIRQKASTVSETSKNKVPDLSQPRSPSTTFTTCATLKQDFSSELEVI